MGIQSASAFSTEGFPFRNGSICDKDDLSGVACGEIAISLREPARDFPLLFRLFPPAGKEKRRVVPGEDRHGRRP